MFSKLIVFVLICPSLEYKWGTLSFERSTHKTYERNITGCCLPHMYGILSIRNKIHKTQRKKNSNTLVSRSDSLDHTSAIVPNVFFPELVTGTTKGYIVISKDHTIQVKDDKENTLLRKHNQTVHRQKRSNKQAIERILALFYKHENSSRDLKDNYEFETESSITKSYTVISDSNAKYNSTIEYEEVKTSWWQEFLDRSQLVVAICGFFANITSFVTLVKNGQAFSRAILILLRHQSIVDSWACLFASLVLLQPSMWVTGNYAMDRFICHAWHGQAIYWGSVFISIWNLVTLAFERYLAVCHPFKHQNLTPGKLYTIFIFIYILSPIATSGANLQVDLKDGKCVAEDFLKGPAGNRFYYGYSISALFTFYCLPCSVIITFYGLVIITFYKRRQQSHLASSRVIDKATTELTKTAVTVTCIFIIALGFESWYFLLRYVASVKYDVNSNLQKIGIWLSCINSTANPFVYALLMPIYRRSMQNTFFICSRRKPESHQFL